MQFIPSTWNVWQADGNADGISDPNNVFDASLAAARYLCASGELGTDESLSRSIFSYNHSDEYVADVLGWSRAYAGG
jgi:membrane-bound lytic murein transglycosylase B